MPPQLFARQNVAWLTKDARMGVQLVDEAERAFLFEFWSRRADAFGGSRAIRVASVAEASTAPKLRDDNQHDAVIQRGAIALSVETGE